MNYGVNCVDWQERIALHAGGDAAPGEAEEVARHLSECPGCQVFWSGMKQSLAVLRQVHAELPDAAHFTAVRSRVIAELERSRQTWRRLAWISGMAVTLMLMVALWTRTTTEVPVAPRMVAVIPPAPQVIGGRAKQVVHQHLAKARRKKQVVHQHLAEARQEKRAPITIQMQTSDPKIVIYWIAD